MISFVSAISSWPVLTRASDVSALRRQVPDLVAPRREAADFTSLCDAAHTFGRCFRRAGAPPEAMVIALKATLATSYGSIPSLAEDNDAVANVHHVAASARWYPLVLTSALNGFFTD